MMGLGNISRIRADIGMWAYPEEDGPDVIPPAADVASWAISKQVKQVYAGLTQSAAGDSAWVTWMRDLKTALPPDARLYATQGLPEWADDGSTAAATWASTVLALTDGSGRRLFRGVMLDVEPLWLFDEPQQTEENMGNWLDMQTSVTAAVHASANPNGSPPAESWAVLQFWLNTLSLSGQQFDRQMLAATDGCAFMTYRDSASAILTIAADCVASAAAVRKPIRLTVETANAGEGANVDYFGDSRAAMEADLRAVMHDLTVAKSNPWVRGIDVHHYQSWVDMNA